MSPLSFKALTLLMGTASIAFPAEWLTSLPQAQQLAGAEQRLILADFTGSDWCGACMRLRRQVLDTPEFESLAADLLVLLEVDLPQNAAFDATLRAENEALCKRFGVRGFPTVLLLTPDARVVGGFPPVVKDAESARKTVLLAQESASMLAKAAESEGELRAHLLAQVYRSLPQSKSFDAARVSLLKQVQAACPRDVTGLLSAGAVQEQAAQFARERSIFAPNDPLLAPLLERQLAEAHPQNRPGILRARVQYGMAVAQTVDDLEQVRRQLKELIPQLPPEEAATEQHLLDHFFQDLPALLNTLKHSRQGY